MTEKRLDAMICSNCNFEIATIIRNSNGQRELRVAENFQIRILETDLLREISCPRCNNKVFVESGFFEGF